MGDVGVMTNASEPFEKSSLRDVVMLLSGMEERLTEQFNMLSAQLEERHNHKTKKYVKINSATSLEASMPALSTQLNTVVPDKSTHQQFQIHAHHQKQKPTNNSSNPSTHSSAPTESVPHSASASQSIWKRYGKKPSETARQFLREALTRKEKKKTIYRKAQAEPTRSKENQQSEELTTPSPLHGVSRVLDLKVEERGGDITETYHGWWRPDHEEFALFSTAKRHVQNVFDLLLARGWLVSEDRHIVADREIITRTTSCLNRLVNNQKFELVCALMIISNAILLGFQTQHKASPENDDEVGPWHETLQAVFTCWFAVEVFLRICAWRLNFFISKYWQWNVFDLTIVSISLVEALLQIGSQDEQIERSNLTVCRIIRILRMVRAIRFFRVVRFLVELRMMLYSSVRCMKPFFWAIVILYIIIYVFSVITTQIVSDYRRANSDADLRRLLNYFGSLNHSIFTLFQVVSGGVSWEDPANELLNIHWTFSIWMSLYVAFVQFAVLNIVTGIFVESSLRSAQRDQDIVIQEEMSREDSLAQGFMEVFHEFDEDKSGYIDAEEFIRNCSDQRVRAFLHHLGLDIPEAHSLFRLLDVGGTGKVYAREFVIGCQQLKGPAKTVDVATLLFQNKRMMTLWAVFMSFCEDQFATLQRRSNRPDPGAWKTGVSPGVVDGHHQCMSETLLGRSSRSDAGMWTTEVSPDDNLAMESSNTTQCAI